MNAKTVTEKYRAVNEGNMAKREFVRQMRQSYPMYVSQYDGFDSTVQILKNKGMLYEAPQKAFSGVKVYDDRPALTYSLDALERGIRIELQSMGKDLPNDFVSPEDYLKAENKAKSNLEKDANHYLNLMSGESNKVDKHDKEKEVKRGALDKDTFNDMKKATLKEGINEDEEEDAKNDQDSYDHDYPHQDESKLKERLTEKLSNPTLLAAVKQIKAMHPEVTSGIIDDFIDMHGQDILDGADPMDEFHNYVDANYEGPSDMREAEEGIDFSSKDGYIAFIDNENILANYTPEDAEEMARELAMTHHDAGQDQDNFVKSFMAAYKEGGYDYDDQVHEKQGKDHDGDGDIDSDDYMAAKDKAIKKAMGKDESYAMKRMQQAHTQDRLAGKKSTYDKAKEKNDKQKAQLKEAIKSIIKKTLINEAATVKLADWAEGYESFPGVKPVVNELENIVTEIESFYDKMSDKIAKVFEKTSGFENEEGLKIGGFIAPGLESAFKQDLSKVIKGGSFFKKIELPKVRTITQADVDAHNSGERPLGETEIEEEPKSTIFTPNF